jgi:hypothetical protein
MRKPQHRQSQADGGTDTEIDGQLGDEKSGQPLTGVVESEGRLADVGFSRDADEAVA